jgi:hypothetical protein
MATQVSAAEEWKEHVAELRQLAKQTEDAERQQKLLELADRWEVLAKELSQKDF